MSSPAEIQAAAMAAIKHDMPYTVTASFDTAGKTMMGMAPAQLHEIFSEFKRQPEAIGANCGVGAPDLLASLLEITAMDESTIVIAKANCGIPQIKGEKVEYSGSPELMADYARLAVDAGARIVGGCCGTSCTHLSAMRAALDNHQKGPRPDLDIITQKIGHFVNKTVSAKDDTPKRERHRRRKVNPL